MSAREPLPMALPEAARQAPWLQWLPALLVTLAYLVPALAWLDDYGPTYDAIKGEYPYGERLLGYLETGDERFLNLRLVEPVPHVRAPHPDFDLGRYPTHWIFPAGALLSALSCRLFWTELGWLPAMSAHHLPSVLLTAVLVLCLCRFAARRLGTLGGIVAGGALFLTPSLFGHSFNNPKDVPECALYALAVLAGYRAIERRSARVWVLAGALTGLALAQKANALFLPVQLLVFIAGGRLVERSEPRPRLGLRDLGAATLGFLALYYAISPAFWSEPIEGPRRWFVQMLEVGNHAFREGVGERPVGISWSAPLSVLQSTPPLTLLLALIGLCAPGLGRRLRWFLLVSVALPIARNLLPGMRNFDGTRHFLEFLPFLALLAGAGAAWLARALSSRLAARLEPRRARAAARALAGLVGLVALVPAAWATLSTHPNQIAYFNVFAGGLDGAQASGNRDAADYWGNTYWQGLGWLAAEAEPGARILVPYKDFIARSAAPVRLRADLRIERPSTKVEGLLPVYVMELVNRGRSPFVEALAQGPPPVHEIGMQGGSLLRIHRLEDDTHGRNLMRLWAREHDTRTLKREVLVHVHPDPELERAVLDIYRARLDPEEALERLRPLLPPEILGKIERTLADPELEGGETSAPR